MKHFLVSLFTFLIFSVSVAAQDANGYFVVVETNIHEQDHSFVKIYDEKDKLVYEEYIEGIYIDITTEEHRKLILEVDELFSFFMGESIEKDRYEGFIELIFHRKI